jgi:DNA-binding beta-propeller fold protein YncE
MQTPSPRAIRSLTLAALSLAAPAALAGAGEFFVLDNATNGLYRGQTGLNGSDSLVGALPAMQWYDLAPGFDGSFVFAITNADFVALSTVDGTVLTSIVPDREFISIATDVATSTVYAVTQSVPGTPQVGELITLDTATGQTTTIGQLGGTADALSLVGLGFDPFTGGLFMTAASGELLSVDAGTGAATLIGNTGLDSPFDVDYNPADGQMYVTDAQSEQLFLLDRNDASVALSTLYTEASYTTGLAFAIPTPGTTVLLALAGLGATRRRR